MKQIDCMTAEHKPKPLNIKSPFNAFRPCENCVPQTLSSWLDGGDGCGVTWAQRVERFAQARGMGRCEGHGLSLL